MEVTTQAAFKAEEAIVQALFQELSPRNLRYYIASYGCQMNAHDSEKLAGILESCGYTPCNSMENADLILFNTCCVREHAEKRVFGNIGALKKLKDENPSLLIGVCGCMMQQEEAANRLYMRFPFVNMVFGTHNLHKLPGLLQSSLRGERRLSVESGEGDIIEGLPARRAPGISASINIMYGCDNFCSYCIVPFVRGRERSRLPRDILGEAKSLAAQGYSELQLLGQNVNSYRGGEEGQNFAWLLREINDQEGIQRIRFMTSHPKDLSDDLIEAVASCDHVCNHIHLPVQSGSNRVLHEMNRGYTREKYLQLLEKLRSRNPGIEITTDIIVGFPGETDGEFSDTLSLIKEAGFSAAFTFMYSPRRGTKAATMENQIAANVKKQRLLELNAIQEEVTKRTNLKYIGGRGEVLVEGCDTREATMLFGKLSSFKMVYFPGSIDMIGKYVSVEIMGMNKNSLVGKLLPEGI